VKLAKIPSATTIIEVGAGIGLLVFLVWSIRGFQARKALPASDAA
jgi:hypothetical protein